MRNDGGLPDGSLDLLSAQALRVQEAGLALSDEIVLFTLGAQMAWLEFWAHPFLQAGAELQAWQARQARTARLVRRGVPEPLAREGLHLLPTGPSKAAEFP
ncbi:hypothetical protein BHAOGJBA_6029 [Methylobacterium hispanicum]|uniref:Uncharacterized protein n=1 Tax=Methylobacterium hispanicum TaxID=270350 RepID=A0AAV4ZZN0_9HYPH|nr:hypothetical protein BHAOGJBA_6029 [Methylobacterium hispanicum]